MEGYTFSTGLPGLDRVLKGVLPGDNVVWQLDAVDEYKALIDPCVAWAHTSGRPLVYFRFAPHEPLVEPGPGVHVEVLDPAAGFEAFVSAMHERIRIAGRGATYIFDCLSPLAETWYSDVMLGNFFKLMCPYLFDMETLAYFGVYRNHHSVYALDPILATTQLFLDVYRCGAMYIRPLKVQQRYSATMNMLHRWENGDTFSPVSDSAEIAGILTSAKWSGLYADRNPGFWDRAFLDASDVRQQVEAGHLPAEAEQMVREKLVPMVVTRDEPMVGLVNRYMTLEDVLDVRRRMIGSGLIGGKAVGMLLARAILRRQDTALFDQLEAHDSFFIGSDVFYSYLVDNGIWWTRQRQKDTEAFYENATRARRLIITGKFPARTLRQFEEMVDYFGQSPFIVRSSSLLEDNFGNAFAGKYESVFCANQGPRSQRIEDFVAAVKRIYASAMSERALRYRARRGMLDQDEQMALLVMRVSGRAHGKRFFPPAAGVGFSFNPYVWHPDIDPDAGVIRLVAGLGTRAVDRVDDDCTRLVALNAPMRRPDHNIEAVRSHTQRRVDFIDLDDNHLTSGSFDTVMPALPPGVLDLLAPPDREAVRMARSAGARLGSVPRLLTFDPLLETSFTETMRRMLHVLQDAYAHPVDIEFTVNFDAVQAHKINLVQCRPLQVMGTDTVVFDSMPVCASEADALLSARCAVIGQSRVVEVDHVVYVVPSVYSALPMRDRYAVARALGKLNHALQDHLPGGTTVLLGPGRWGTSSPELGVPVLFHEISGVAVLGEIVTMHANLIPDVSLGTHFLNELVEMDMLYVALLPGQADTRLDEARILAGQSILCELVPDAAQWDGAIRVVPARALVPESGRLLLRADAREQRVMCFPVAQEGA
jgi:pyruvate, water dikinase